MIVSVTAHCKKCWMWIHVFSLEDLKRSHCSCHANDWNMWIVTTEMMEKTQH